MVTCDPKSWIFNICKELFTISAHTHFPIVQWSPLSFLPSFLAHFFQRLSVCVSSLHRDIIVAAGASGTSAKATLTS